MSPPFLMEEEKFKKKDFEKLLVRIKVYRAGNSLTQSEMAKRLNLSLRTYQRVEQGVAPLDIETLYQMANIYNISYKTIAEPKYTISDLPNVQFYPTLESIENINGELSQAFKSIIQTFDKSLQVEKKSLSDLHKLKEFKDSPLPLYYSDPKWTWCNKTLRKAHDPTQKGRVSVMRNMSDFVFIIKLWEICYDSPHRFFISKTIHETPEVRSVEVSTLNYFDLIEGFPFTRGLVLGSKSLN
ncbi:MAG: helix-turn-helix transcriptional regulator [Halobacteriovoraceae bacterium]|nr:helix-turn-helix transcriptional regulator [Halobacteriovoraceae bacterium]